ncbi:MAG: hypothetical protein MJY95_08435 [Bacteroidaceae bacterium]|nr:hypothetical protein [Bacteroidaceae bacterium]
MRKFYLYVDGTRYSLNGENGLWFLNPSGMGASMQSTYATITDGFFSSTDMKSKQGSIAGDFAWTESGYSGYKTMVDAIFTADNLRIGYNPDGVEYFADCQINYITKGESYGAKILKAPVSFILLTPWYIEEQLTGAGTVSVSAGGQIASAVKVVSTGTSLVNPYISMSANGEEFARCEISMNLSTSNSLEYSNFYDDSHIIGVINGVRTNLIENLTARHNIYSHKFGAYTVNLSDSNGASPAISVTVRRYWRTV